MRRARKEADDEADEADEEPPEEEQEEEEERPKKKSRSTSAKSSAKSSSKSAKRDLASSSKSQKSSGKTSARRAPAGGGASGSTAASEARKLLAIKVTAGVFVLFVIIAIYAVSTKKPPQVHDTSKDIDYPKMVQQAKTYCEEAARKVRDARPLKDKGDKAGALRKFEEAMALLDKATELYEKVSNAHPGGEFDYMGADIDRMTLERTTYRKMMMELRN